MGASDPTPPMSLKDWATVLGAALGFAAFVWNVVKEVKKLPRFTATVEWSPDDPDPNEVVRLRYFNAGENDVQVVGLWYERRRFLRKPERFYSDVESTFPEYRMMEKVPKHEFKDLDREVDGREPDAILFPRGIKVCAVVELASGKKVRSNTFQRLPPLSPWKEVGKEDGGIRWRREDGSEERWESEKRPADEDDIRKLITRNRPPQ